MFICAEPFPLAPGALNSQYGLVVVHESSLIDSPAGRELSADAGDYVENDDAFHSLGMPVQTMNNSFPQGVHDYVLVDEDPLTNGTPAIYTIGAGPNYAITGPTALPGYPARGNYSLGTVGSENIDLSFTAHRPVYQNGYIYNARSLSSDQFGDLPTVYYAKYQTSNWTLAESGWISATDIAPSTAASYPAISIDPAGDVAVGFTATGPNIYAGAYYALHRSFDAPGEFSLSGTLAQGEATYDEKFGNWGDYSGISLDPSGGSRFWIYNQYAKLDALHDPARNWGTRLGSFAVSPPESVVQCTGGADVIDVLPVMEGSGVGALEIRVNGIQQSSSDSDPMYPYFSPGSTIQIQGLGGDDSLILEPNAMLANCTIAFDGGAGANTLKIGAGDFGGSAVIDNGTFIAGGIVEFANIQSLEYDGGTGDDTLTYDASVGTPLPSVIFNGGAGTNLVNLIGTLASDSVALDDATTVLDSRTISLVAVAAMSYKDDGGNDAITTTGSIPKTLTLDSGADALTLNGSGPVTIVPGAGSIALTANAGTATIAASTSSGIRQVNFTSLHIASGAKVVAQATSATPGDYSLHANRSVLVAGALQLVVDTSGNLLSTLDLGDNDLILRDGGTTGLGAIHYDISSGFAAGAWNGTGLDSSIASGSTPAGALGFVLNDGSQMTPFTTFDGVAVGSSDVLVKYTYAGDADLNGQVNGDDYFYIDSNYPMNSGSTWVTGDFDYNGVTNGDDYFYIDNNYLAGTGGANGPQL